MDEKKPSTADILAKIRAQKAAAAGAPATPAETPAPEAAAPAPEAAPAAATPAPTPPSPAAPAGAKPVSAASKKAPEPQRHNLGYIVSVGCASLLCFVGSAMTGSVLLFLAGMMVWSLLMTPFMGAWAAMMEVAALWTLHTARFMMP